MNNYNDFIARKRAQYGEKFNPSDLAPQFIPYYESGQRIEVKQPYKDEPNLRGYVGIATGWKPVFILLSKSNSHGSSEILSAKYKIVKTINKFI